MSGYEGDANGNGPAGLNMDGAPVKEPLKPKASGKGDADPPTFDRNSMVCHDACIRADTACDAYARACKCAARSCAPYSIRCTRWKAVMLLVVSCMQCSRAACAKRWSCPPSNAPLSSTEYGTCLAL